MISQQINLKQYSIDFIFSQFSHNKVSQQSFFGKLFSETLNIINFKIKQERIMQAGSLQNSSSIKSLNQDLNHTEILSEYLTNKFDFFATTVIDYMEEKDPHKRFGKISAARLKETQNLRKENVQLREKLVEQRIIIDRLTNQINKFKGPKSNPNFNGQNSSSYSYKVGQSSELAVSEDQKLPTSLIQILPEDQKNSINMIDEIEIHAKQQRQEQQRQLSALIQYFENLCEKLARIVKIEKVTENDSYNQETMTITLSKQKYDILIDFYCQGSYLGPIEIDESYKVEQFRAQQNKPPNQSIKQSKIWTIEELQKMFQYLAQKNSKSQEWKQYLQNRQSEDEKRLNKIKKISESRISKQNLEEFNGAKALHRSSQNMTDPTLDTTGSLISHFEKQIEDNLFKKIKNLMNELEFSQDQYNLFASFDEKRKCGRLYNVEEFLHKFKEKTDLYQISQAFSVYLIKTVNFMLVNVMQLLCASNPENLDWFNQKLIKKSDSFRKAIFKALEQQCTLYMKQKYAKNPKQREKNIWEVSFDKEKELEKELTHIVYQYKDIIRSSIFNSNYEVLVKT